MNSLAVIPGFYILKDGPAGFFEIRIRMPINFLLLKNRVERFDTRIIIGISFAAEGMAYSPAAQAGFKYLAGVLAPKIAVKDDPCRILHIQASIFLQLLQPVPPSWMFRMHNQ